MCLSIFICSLLAVYKVLSYLLPCPKFPVDRGDITITLSTFIAHYLFMASAVHVFYKWIKYFKSSYFKGFRRHLGTGEPYHKLDTTSLVN